MSFATIFQGLGPGIPTTGDSLMNSISAPIFGNAFQSGIAGTVSKNPKAAEALARDIVEAYSKDPSSVNKLTGLLQQVAGENPQALDEVAADIQNIESDPATGLSTNPQGFMQHLGSPLSFG